MQLPTEPGFYWCTVSAIVRSRYESREPRSAILEVIGEPPYLRAFLHAYQECNEITPENSGLLFSVGPRLADCGHP